MNTISRLKESLYNFKQLNYVGWNGYDAEPIPIELIEKASIMLNYILDNENVEIFPSAVPSIQFEYEDDEKYVEIEIRNDCIKVFYDLKGTERKTEKYNDLILATERFNAIALGL